MENTETESGFRSGDYVVYKNEVSDNNILMLINGGGIFLSTAKTISNILRYATSEEINSGKRL